MFFSIMSAPKHKKTYHFHGEWEEQFFVVMHKDKCICLICNMNLAIPKKGNIERHFTTVHRGFQSEAPVGSELRKKKLSSLKSKLQLQQSCFVKPVETALAANVASFHVSQVLMKHKKPFDDGLVFKECFLAASESLFSTFKNKTEIISAIKAMPLSRPSVTRKVELMAENVQDQLKTDMRSCRCFSIQLDESVDQVDSAQVMVFARLIFADFSVKEELLTIMTLKDTTRGEDVYNTFKSFITEYGLPIEKLASITTDGAPSMVGKHKGFIKLCSDDETFPPFFSYHCILHQQALCGKIMKMAHVMNVVVKIVNSIRSKSLQRRKFRVLLEELDSQYGELQMYTEVRWLSRGMVLSRFMDLLPEIRTFLSERLEEYPQLNDLRWLLDLAFLSDITCKLNELNKELQGKNQTIVVLMSHIQGFMQKLNLWIAQIQKCNAKHFPQTTAELSRQQKALDFETAKDYEANLAALKKEFQNRFSDFKSMEPFVTFIVHPFQQVDGEDISSKISTQFVCSESELENEIIGLQNDISLKSECKEDNFWSLVSEQKYPNIVKVASYVLSFFGSTYQCESAFSIMNIVKSKCRNKLTDSHLSDCVRLALTNYSPDYYKLANSMQSQPSH